MERIFPKMEIKKRAVPYSLILSLCISLVLFATFSSTAALANDGKVTFLNNAQKAGTINAEIYYEKNGKKNQCTVTGTVNHPVGTTPTDKAVQLASDITAQCVNVKATSAGGTVTISSVDNTVEITEIDIKDKTNQKKTINPKTLNDDKKYLAINITGDGTGGTAYVSMDDCGSWAETSAGGKTGTQVAAELVAALTNCDSASGSTIEAVDLGNGIGEIRFLWLSNANSTITFDTGGDFGLEDILSVMTRTPYPDIVVNGLDGPVDIFEGAPLSVTVALDAGGSEGIPADWYVYAPVSPFGPYYYSYPDGWVAGFGLTYSGPLFNFSPYEVLNMILPVGAYTFCFDIDTGTVYSDCVDVNIFPPS